MEKIDKILDEMSEGLQDVAYELFMQSTDEASKEIRARKGLSGMTCMSFKKQNPRYNIFRGMNNATRLFVTKVGFYEMIDDDFAEELESRIDRWNGEIRTIMLDELGDAFKGSEYELTDAWVSYDGDPKAKRATASLTLHLMRRK